MKSDPNGDNFLRQIEIHEERADAQSGEIERHRYFILGDRMPFPYFKGLREMMLRNFSSVEGKRILDVGCGWGYWSTWLALRGAEVVSVDISHGLLRIARKHAAANGVAERARQTQGDAAALPFREGTFDMALGNAVAHHLTVEEEAAFAAGVRGALKPGGRAVFWEPVNNMGFLTGLKNLLPTVNRPSALAARAWREHESEDPHPRRPTTSAHYREVFSVFGKVKLIETGIFNRLDQFFTIEREGLLTALHGVDYAAQRFAPFRRTFARNVVIECEK